MKVKLISDIHLEFSPYSISFHGENSNIDYITENNTMVLSL